MMLDGFRTYGVPLDATGIGYARRITETAAVAQWIAQALAENDFLPFEEPYRGAPPAGTR
jgi:glutathione S-transferase